MIWQNIKNAFISIRSAKLRSFLTMLGIIIGVSSVVTILAIGEGVKASVRDQVTTLGTNLVQVNPGQAFEEGEEGQAGGFNFASMLGTSTLTETDVTTISKTQGVDAAAPYMITSGVLSSETGKAPNAFIGATTSDYIKAVNQKTAKGRFLQANEPSNNVIVLGSGTAEKLFKDQDPVGKTVKLRNTELTVIGVMEEIKTGINLGVSLNDAVFIPFELGKEFNNGNANIMEIEVKIAKDANVDSVVTDIKNQLKQNHKGTQDFSVTTAEDQLEVFDTVFSILTTFIAAIAAISLLVGGIGIMNIMLVTVAERTREIGIRKAIGATSGNIMFQFLIEAIIISLLGGAIGVGLSYLAGLGIKAALDITPVFSVEALMLAAGVSLFVGVVFGTAPAIKAARKRPIQALKAL